MSPTADTRHALLARLVWATADAAMVLLAVLIAAWLRYDYDPQLAFAPAIIGFALTAAVLHSAFVLVNTAYRDCQRGSFEEAAQVAIGVIVLGATLVVVRSLPTWESIPRSLPLIAPALAVLGMFASRFIVRAYRHGQTAARPGERAVLYGAGEGAHQLVRALLKDSSDSRLVPVALLDDDPRKRRWRIQGIPVRGPLAGLGRIAEATDTTTLIVSAPSMGADRVRAAQAAAREHDLRLLVMPPVDRMLGSTTHNLRELNLEDLLGRRKVDLDDALVASAIGGKVVLVTGAGGSIGSELCRQISRFGPAKLVMLDRDESALHAVQMSLTGRALLDDGTLALCDIRDEEAVAEVFRRERPHVVFHAAALKHLTLLELHPLEAWKTNVRGTLNVLTAAKEAGVSTFVNVSTDKAADPSCVLGYSKRITERLTADFAEDGRGTWVSVRFGNVLGSRGSVIGAFTAQIERGGPVTVTHPEVERYFMLIPEACQLVLQAGAIGRHGEVMVLDMGEPVRILELAKTLIGLSGKAGVDIQFTGLRPGEKLSEDLFTHGEDIQRSAHPLISHVPVPTITRSRVRATRHESADDAFAWMLREAAEAVVSRPPARAPRWPVGTRPQAGLEPTAPTWSEAAS